MIRNMPNGTGVVVMTKKDFDDLVGNYKEYYANAESMADMLRLHDKNVYMAVRERRDEMHNTSENIIDIFRKYI